MEHFSYADFAEALVLVHGARADKEVAKHAELCRKAGNQVMAQSWQKIGAYLPSQNSENNKHAA